MIKKSIELLKHQPEEFMQLLLETQHSSLNPTVDELGNTILHVATRLGRNDIVNFLLRHNVFVDVLNDSNDSPLNIAVRYQQTQIVRTLLQHKPNLTDLNKYGFASIHIAAALPNEEILQLLLHAGAPIELKTHTGATALMLAVSKKLSLNITSLLIGKANVDSKNSDDVSSIDIAIKNKDPISFELLLRFECKLPNEIPQAFKKIISTYQSLRTNKDNQSIIKSLLVYNQGNLPTLKQITAWVIAKSFLRETALTEKLRPDLQRLIEAVPKNILAKPFFSHKKLQESKQEETNLSFQK